MRQWTTLHKYIWLRILQGANAVYETVKGAIISFTTKRAAPLTELKVEFSPVQDLHGYDSPWPAGGGKNKFDANEDNVVYRNGGTYFTLDCGNGTVKMTVNTSQSLALYALFKCFEIESADVGNAFVRSDSGNDNSIRIIVADLDGSNRVEKSSPYTVQAEDVGKALCLRFYNDSGADRTWTDVQLELGSTASSYEPYTNTVYGGYADPATGDGAIAGVKVNLANPGSSTKWSRQSRNQNVGGYMFVLQTTVFPGTDLLSSDMATAKLVEKCSHAPINNPYDRTTTCAWAFQASAGSATLVIRVNVEGIQTLEDFNSWLAEQGNVEFYYPISDSIPFHIDPQIINTLKGDNTMWANTNGDIEATYRSN